jgi:6-phosphogluconate dehydrogenase
MQLGMIGLGCMGANMAIRLAKAGHTLHVYDRHASPVEDLATKGATRSTDLEAFVRGLTAPRAVWLMLPAAAVDPALSSLTPLLEPGDTVIDGGNSFYQDDVRRAETLRTKGLHSANRRRAHAAHRATEPAGSKSLARRDHPRPAR